MELAAIAAGERHSLALQANGTVVAWGYNKEKQCEIPPGLSHVKAISTNTWYSLALKTDGTVVALGTQSNRGETRGAQRTHRRDPRFKHWLGP